MITLVVVFLAGLSCAAVAWGFYRALEKRVVRQKMRPFFAVALYWIAVALVPWCLLWIEVPLANSVYMTFTVLQTAAWDIGLAMSLYLGMVLSYLVGVVAGALATRQFLLGASHGV